MRRLSQSIDTGSVEERLADLRQRLDQILEEQVSPTLSRAGDRAQQAARHVRDTARREAGQVMEVARERPLATIAVAMGVGYLLARMLRR
ncbi:hypothetical protein NON00_15935 [Roseomonas sp. GC11]|uniref:hypothetical protein n=1 Tax=Roseomonas sp. GC11 TaxID=2950546 RepID=UPI00210A4F5A|nr:hypothetical protein [Roseomonas sp. GC11]MCQ4161410.1 hypothetical protein [Roseomonas sp. GC11]